MLHPQKWSYDNLARVEAEGIEYLLPSRVYVPDFYIPTTGVYIEAKGYFDNDARKKMIAVKACNPDKKFVLLFQRDVPVRKGAKMKYSDWCKKYDFDYAIGKVKEEWIVPA